MTDLPGPEALAARLQALAAARGFLLPHHGALAAGAPELHAAYAAMYEALTVAPRVLSALERESVWLCLLVASREGIGTHHLELYREAGGSDAAAETLVTLTGHAGACDALDFAARSWPAQLPGLEPSAAYARGIAALRNELPEPLAELCLLTVQGARGCEAGVAHHLRRLYALDVPEPAMVEALSYLIWPKGVNAFVEACAVWHALMVAGEITPSPRFAVWRDMPGLGAYDPAGGRKVGGFGNG